MVNGENITRDNLSSRQEKRGGVQITKHGYKLGMLTNDDDDDDDGHGHADDHRHSLA